MTISTHQQMAAYINHVAADFAFLLLPSTKQLCKNPDKRIVRLNKNLKREHLKEKIET